MIENISLHLRIVWPIGKYCKTVIMKCGVDGRGRAGRTVWVCSHTQSLSQSLGREISGTVSGHPPPSSHPRHTDLQLSSIKTKHFIWKYFTFYFPHLFQTQ